MATKRLIAALTCGLLGALGGRTDGAVPAATWNGVFVEGRTAEGKCFYAPNEKMHFDLALPARAPTGTWFVAWTRTGDDGKTEKGRGRAPLRVTTSLATPGFVRLEAWVEDAAGMPVSAPANPHGRVFFDGGAGVSPERLVPPPEPRGFDAWWRRHVAALSAVPPNPRLREVPSGRADVRAYAFALDCPGGLACTGWAAIPVASGRFPLRAKFFGYNESWSPRATAPRKPGEMSAKEIRVWVSPHGIEQGRDAAYYAAVRKRVSAGFGGHAWSPAENASPDTSYFAQMAWRVLRGLAWAKTLPCWDGARLVVEGGSQGALQCVWAAAWDRAVTEADISIVWHCDAWGKAKAGRLIGDWALPWAEGLRWFDAVSHARRIPMTCRVNVVHAGLGDYISPPSGVAALYNAVRGPKRIRWVQGSEHSWCPSGAHVQAFACEQGADAAFETPRVWPAEFPAVDGVKPIFYEGAAYRGKPTRVFAYLAVPEVVPGRKVPGLVLVHGGLGSAFRRWARFWRDQGYAAISMDTCGCVSGNEYGDEQRGHRRHAWAGPAGWGGFARVDEPLADQWPRHAVSAVIRAHSLLRSLPQVDAAHVGITGVSWGGYLTCVAASLDPRFACAAPVYGCGFLEDGSVWETKREDGASVAQWRRWCAFFDPRHVLPLARCPFLWIDGSNDFAYPLPALQRSVDAADACPHCRATRLRMPHGHADYAEHPKELVDFAAAWLKGGAAYPRCTGQRTHGRRVLATFEAGGSTLTSAELEYTTDDGAWQKRLWRTAPARLDAATGTATADLPPDVRAWYVNAQTADGKCVSSDVVFSD